MRTAMLLALAFGVGILECEAQDTTSPAAGDAVGLKREADSLHVVLDSLRSGGGSMKAVDDDDLEQLEERIERRLQELERKIDAVSRASAPTLLNPRTTAFINFAARGD